MDQKDLHKLEKDQLQNEIANTTAVGKFTLSSIVTNYQSLDRIAKKAVRLTQRLIDENFKHQREQALLDNKLKETSKKVEQLKEKRDVFYQKFKVSLRILILVKKGNQTK
jgi:hypothetical protein